MEIENKRLTSMLMSILKMTDMGVCSYDMVTGEVIISDEVFKIVGFDKRDFDGTMQYIVANIIHPDDRLSFVKALETDIRNRSPQTREYRINHPLKESCWIRINGKFDYDESGKPICFFGSVLDITDEVMSLNTLNENMVFFNTIIDTLPSPVFYKNKYGVYVHCNKAFLELTGLEKSDVIGKTVYDIAPYELAKAYHDADELIVKQKTNQVYEAQVKNHNGELRDIMFSKAVNLDLSGEVIGIVGIMQDITEKKLSDHVILLLNNMKDSFLSINHSILIYKNLSDFFESLLLEVSKIFIECSQGSVIEIDSNKMIKIVASFGYCEEDVQALYIPLNDSFIWKQNSNKLTNATIINDIQTFISENKLNISRTKSGELVQSSLVIPIQINETVRWILMLDSSYNHIFKKEHLEVADFIRAELPMIYQIFELNQKNLHLTWYDSLTGLLTRSRFESIFNETLRYCEEESKKACIVMFDLDGLKRINDHLGHLEGDYYLKKFSNLMRLRMLKIDQIARVGGDEFIGIFVDDPVDRLTEKIEVIRNEFIDGFKGTCFEEYKPAFSYGISIYPEDHTNSDYLIKVADERMYVYKNSNK